MTSRRAFSTALSLATLLVALLASSLAFAGPASTTWTNEYPAPGSVLNQSAGVVGVDAMSSVALQAVTRQMTVDGVTYASFFSNPQAISGHWAYKEVWDDVEEMWVADWVWVQDLDVTKITVATYARSGPLGADGTHTVTATIKNVSGTSSTDTWSFAVRVPPVIGAPSPAPDSVLDTTTPDINVPVSDNTAIASWTVTVNGVTASATKSGGMLHIVLPAPLANESHVNIVLSVSDGVSVPTTLAWGYDVQTFPGMLNTIKQCESCHPDSAASLDMTAMCANCHAGMQTPHTGNPSQYHAKADTSCTPCHLQSIPEEHARWVSKAGTAITCVTCHASTDPAVRAAILAKNTNCGSCHDASNPHSGLDLTAQHTASPADANISFLGKDYGTKACDDCHTSLNVIDVHKGNCATCHPTPYSTVSAGWDRGCVQGGCHTAGTTKPMHANLDTAHTATAPGCTAVGCHTGGTNVADIHAVKGCSACHADGVTPSTDCTQCHNTADPHGDISGQHLSSPADATITISGVDFGSRACADCHPQAGLLTIHGSDCTKCHPTPRNSLTPSWDRSCAQGGCHTAGSTKPMHANIDAKHGLNPANTGCGNTGCHTGSLADLHSAATTTVAGVVRTSCTVCHTGDGALPASNCGTCHGDTTGIHFDYAKHTASPASQDATIAGVNYGPQVCSDCHASDVLTIHNVDCTTCHPTPKNTLTPSWDKSCAQGGCHTAGSTKPQHGTIDAAHVVPSVTCSNVGCHDGISGSLAALHSTATTTVAGVTRTSCQICHAAGSTPSNQCALCHNLANPHTTAPAAVHEATFSTATVTILGSNVGDHNCAECHASKSLTVIHNDACTLCHPSPRDTLTPSWDKSCAQGGCHTAGSTKPLHGNIDSKHTLSAQTCTVAGCHAGGVNLALIHSAATTTTAQGTLTSCAICHATGRTPSATCTDCHNTAAPHANIDAAHTTTASACSTGTNCHDVAPGDVRTLHKNVCEDCHDAGKTPSTDCATCHGSNTAYSHGYQTSLHSANPTGTITIDGTSFDDIVCASCHNASSITSTNTVGTMALGSLHDNSCASCHPTVVPNVVSTWNKSCDQVGCHSPSDNTNLDERKPQHTGIDAAHSMVPVAKDCLAGGACHSGTGLPMIHANAKLTENGTTYTGCQVCHKNSLNVPVVPDFTSPDGSVWQNECLGCHQDRWVQHGYTSQRHASTVTTESIVSNGVTINNIVCADCHARGTVTTDTPSGTMELGPIHSAVGLGCDNCHPTPRDTFTTWNKTCDEPGCHGATSTQPTHAVMNSAHTPTEGTSCMIDGCHLGDTTAPGWGTDLPQIHQNATTTVDGQLVKGCLVCHFNNGYDPNGTGTTFATDANGIPNTKECATCHPQGNNTMHAYSFANHTSAPASQTITIGSTTWPQMACSRCHFTELSSEHARNISGFKSKGCFNCHPNPYSSLEAQGQAIGGWNKGCSQADCHAPASASAMHASVTASHTPLPQNNSCFSGTACHTNDGETIADIHSQATTTVAGVVRTQCDVCHGDFAKQSQPPSANCTYCHANKLVNGQVASHVNTDTLHPSASVGSCASDNNSCHFGTLAKEHFRWTPTAGGSFTCETCHSSTDPTVVNAIKNKNSACDACHATHHGTQTPSSNQSCQDCHGTTSTEISSVATSGVYANTGGDHKTGFAESAHASIQTTPTVGDAATTIQCTVCHNHERKNVGKYVDYRYTGWPDPQQNHEDLCFQCHTSTTTVVNEPNKPNTWNGRSVQSQFQLVSKHTISTGSGSFVDQEIPNFTETTQAQFNLETRTNVVTTNVSGGEVKLGQDVSTGVNPPAVTNLLFAKLGGATTMDQYSTADNAWNGSNAAKFSPAAAPGSPAAGASAFRLPGDSKIYFPTASTCYVYTPPADPTADSWTTVPNMGAGAALGAGGDTAVNTTGTATTGQCVYYLRGGSSNYIYMKPYAGSATAAAGRVQYPSGTALNQGAGSAIAFAPNSNRTFIINRNGAAGDGRLYYTSTLNRPTGTATAYVLTQGPSMTTSSTASTVYNRLTAATIGGTDYLFSVGPNYAGSLTLQVVTNVASTPTLLGIGIKPPTGWTSTGDGCDLKYNSADGYLYAIRGGATTSFSRIQVPANPGTASSWTGVNWQALTTQTAQTAGSSIEFANADAPTITPFKFFSAGTFATSSDVNKLAGAARWGNLTFNGAVPANTAMSFKVEGYNSGTGLYDTLVSAGVTSPIDLTSYDCTTYPKVRLTATLSTNDPFNTLASPQLNDWSVSNIKQTYVPPSGSLIQCENCHNTHLVQKGTGGWDKSRVVDPSNVKQLWTGTWADFCLKCHTGAADGSSTQTYAPMISATSIIPYNVAFRPISNPFFSGFSKTTTGMDWASAGHNPANGSEQSGFSQTTQAEFTSDTLNQTVASNVSGGEVKLAQNPNGQPNPVAQSGVAFVNAGGTANFDQYLFDSWNTTNTLLAGTPTNVPASSATGASSFKIPGDNSIYVMSGSTTYQYTPGVDPSTDSWTTNANLVPQQAQSLGADTAVNSASKVIYTTRSGGRNTIYTRLYTSPYTASNMTFSAGSLGAGSSIAYAPTADRLFVLYKNGTTSATGQLFYLAAPGVKTGAQTFTAGPQLAPSGTTSVISRMDVVTTGGADYLFYLGPNASNALSFQVVSNLGSTPATAALPIPTGWTTVADGCDLEYNAADGYIYAIRGGTVGFARIKVPATPATVGSWGTWQTLSQIRPWGAGTTLSFADVDPVPGGTYTLYGSGTVTSPDISAPANSTKWGNLTFTSATPANTALSVTVMGYNSGTSTWDTLIPATSVSPTSLKVYSASLYTKLRLVGNLSTTALTTKASNPEIDDWAVTAYAPSTNSPSCNNCHDPHGSNNPSLVAYSSLNGATVRDNSTAVQGSGLCYKCHGTGSGLDMDVQAPATAAYGHPVAASATKHVDTESIASLATNRHADCSDCHNPHSGQKGTHVALSTSNGAPVLYGAIGVSPTFATGVAANFTTATALTPVTFKSTSSTPEAYLCLKCHAGSGTSLTPVTTTSGTYTRTDLAQEFNPANASYHNVLGQATGTKTTFTNFVNAAGTTFSQTWPIPSASGALTNGLNWNSKITCSDCHTGGAGAQAAGPHGSSAKWMLDPAYPTDWETVTYTNRTASAYICRKCHDMSVTTNSGAHGGNHNNALCIQCHIAVPHGWKRPRLLVYTTDPAPYWKLGASGGLVAVSSTMSHTAASSISWSQNDCGATGTQPTGGTSCSSHGNSTMTAKWK